MMMMTPATLHTWARETAKEILKQMPWDYDPDRDVKHIADIIMEKYIIAEYKEVHK